MWKTKSKRQQKLNYLNMTQRCWVKSCSCWGKPEETQSQHISASTESFAETELLPYSLAYIWQIKRENLIWQCACDKWSSSSDKTEREGRGIRGALRQASGITVKVLSVWQHVAFNQRLCFSTERMESTDPSSQINFWVKYQVWCDRNILQTIEWCYWGKCN